MKADNQVFLFSALMMALGLGGMQAALAEDVFILRPLPVDKVEFPKVPEEDTTLKPYVKPALRHPPPQTQTPSLNAKGEADLQKIKLGPPQPTPTNPGDPRPEAKPWLGGQEAAGLDGQPIPDVDVELQKNPGGSIAVGRTGAGGVFFFDKLPEGNYTLKLPGQSGVPVMVGSSGTIIGKVGKTAGGTGYAFFDVFTELSTAVPKGTGSGGGDKQPGISDQGAAGGLISYGRVPKSGGGGDVKPTNKYADDFTQIDTKLDARKAVPVSGSGQNEGDKAGPIGGFGTGVNSGGPSFGGPNGPGPSMIPAPSMPSMGGPGPMTPGGAGPMSPGGPPVTPMGGYGP